MPAVTITFLDLLHATVMPDEEDRTLTTTFQCSSWETAGAAILLYNVRSQAGGEQWPVLLFPLHHIVRVISNTIPAAQAVQS